MKTAFQLDQQFLQLGLFAESDFPLVPANRRYYAAHPDEALDLLL